METQNKIFIRDEIYSILIRAITDKLPLPPAGWCASQLDEELWRATKEYEPDASLRQRDALETCLAYLVDFSARMPEWINTTETNERVKKMCEELAHEVEKITVAPDEIITTRGKLKSWLKAILAVQTCLIYREETTRVIAENDALKRAARFTAPPKPNALFDARAKARTRKSDLVKNILQKVIGKTSDKPSEQLSEQQPSLF